jgi:arylsulfatase A-like enzyme
MARRGILAAALLLLAACGGGGESEPEPTRSNIILITSDALRPDHLSVNGYARATSPEIDAFAGQALHFTNAVTVIPKTGPAFATMFTGRHPQEHGVRSNFDAIPEGLPVVAERLRDLGYRTAAFVGNPVLRPAKGYARGFDHYQLFDGKRGEGVTSLNAAFRNWTLEETWDRPAFVWIHYMDPHGPYVPPKEILRRYLADDLAASDERVPLEPESLPSGNANKVLGAVPAYQRIEDEDRVAVYVARYDAEIRNMDAAFGMLIGFLRKQGLYDGSAIVFASDHGESLGEHDFYFEHGWFAYEPGLRIPLMIKQPGQTEGYEVDRQVSILDLRPTLLSFAGAATERDVVGVDLRGTVPGREELIENSDHYPDKYYGVRASGWKYLIRERDGAEELYDLREDPGELRNLADREGERLAALRESCKTALDRARAAALPRAAGLPDDPETIERLKAIGYLD